MIHSNMISGSSLSLLELTGCVKAMVKAGLSDNVLDEINMIACATKFEGYITDCPGYTGNIYVLVWGGAPEFVTVLIDDHDIPGDLKVLVNTAGLEKLI